jgi:CHRD domain-containing protein
MKRFAFLLGLLAVTWALVTTATAGNDATTRSVCHRTGSNTTPYVKVSVSARTLRTHTRHAADIIPAPSGRCPRSILTAAAGGRAFTVAMTGEAESPAGDPVGTGTATIRMRAGQGQVCYRITLRNLPPSVGAHIHRGGASVAGPVVVPLTTPNSAGTSSGCAAVARPLVAAMLNTPASYYVNVHTAEFPAGAVRGQLVGTSAASFGWVATLTLAGTTEPSASGTAGLRLRKDAGLVCYRLQVANVTLPTVAAHIHRGATGVSGPVVVPFTAPDANGSSSGCAQATAQLIDEITAGAAGFYVNVHTKEHPGGAIRAQLG